MTELEHIRLECLRLAAERSGHHLDVVEAARAFADFVRGTNDGAIVDAARALADKVRDATAS